MCASTATWAWTPAIIFETMKTFGHDIQGVTFMHGLKPPLGYIYMHLNMQGTFSPSAANIQVW